MELNTFSKLFDLMMRLNALGVKIVPLDGELSIRFPKNVTLDQTLLDEIRRNKNSILEYLRNWKLTSRLNGSELLIEKTERLGKYYYPITPQQHYWVNDEIDEEFKRNERNHGSCFVCYEIIGKNEVSLFRDVVRYLIIRHESLRTIFPCVDGEYLMYVNEHVLLDDYFVYRDARNDYQLETFESFIRYEGHMFNCSKGPLFLVRLCQTEDDKFIISLKIHHSIFDGWSEDVLVKDFLTAYAAFRSCSQPSQSALQCQLKEYTSIINKESKSRYDADKNYWTDLYNAIPPELIIPVERRSVVVEKRKILNYEYFDVSDSLTAGLTQLAKRFSTTLFVLLQAGFKTFMRDATGQTDLVIGTYVHGRDHFGMQEQIGCYSKTVLIRTILKDDDEYVDVIEKVKKSYDDAINIKAYTLIDLFEEKLCINRDLTSFWKINIQFNDLNKSYFSSASNGIKHDVSFVRRRSQVNNLIDIEIQLQFQYQAGKLRLIVQYNQNSFDSSGIITLISGYLNNLENIVTKSFNALEYGRYHNSNLQ
jgi:hypothetical protein